MTMQRRHFQFIANVINKHYRMNEGQGELLAELFADELQHTNPNFNRGRFIEACLKGE